MFGIQPLMRRVHRKIIEAGHVCGKPNNRPIIWAWFSLYHPFMVNIVYHAERSNA
jgi:hypothetical protein